VQRAARQRLASERQAAFAEQAVRRLRECFPVDAEEVRHWPACRRLLDHALHAAAHAEGQEVALPLVGALLNNVGIYLWSTYALAEAKEHLSRALRLLEAAYGPDHPEVARTLTNLGLVAREQGELAEARRLQERALRLKEAAYGPDHPEVALTLANPGNVAQNQGELDEARRPHERALRPQDAA